MKVLKYVLVVIALIFLFYRVGIVIKILCKRKKDNPFHIILNGLIGTFASFEIMTLPFHLFNLNIKFLYYIQIVVFAVIVLFSFILNRKNKIKKYNLKEYIKSKNKKELIIIAILAIMVIAQTMLSSYLYNSNADDSFYVSWSQQAKQLENGVNTDPSLGQEDSSFSKIYIMNSWEVFNGFVARTFDIEVASLSHTIYPFILIPISYMAYYLLIRRIDKKHANIILFILSWIFLFSAVSLRFRGYTLLVRIWQGKTILTNIFIPYILYHMINMNLSPRKIILLMLINMASIAFNPIAIWMFPLLYFFFTIIMLWKKQFKNVLKMLIVILPNLIVLPIYLKVAINGAAGTVQVTNYVGYWETLKDFIRDGQAFVMLYLLSSSYILWKGNKKAKILFVLIPILILLSILNPLISKYVQKYITSSITYWRLFWLIPIELTIAYTMAQIIENRKKYHTKVILTIGIFILIAIMGKNIYTSSGEFKAHNNTEKIPQFIIDETNFILSNSKGKVFVIAPPEPLHGATMRQISSNIILLYSRNIYTDNIKNLEQKLEIYYKIYDGAEEKEIYETFENNKVDFIILEQSNKEKLAQINNEIAKIVYEDEKYFIIANVKSEKINK